MQQWGLAAVLLEKEWGTPRSSVRGSPVLSPVRGLMWVDVGAAVPVCPLWKLLKPAEPCQEEITK